MNNDKAVNEIWRKITDEMEKASPEDVDFKKRIDFPHATIRKIMNAEIAALKVLKSSKNEMPVNFFISQETAFVLAMACEFFVREIGIRAWGHTTNSTRKTVQKVDVYAAVNDSDVYDFLIDTIPRMTLTLPEAQVVHVPPALVHGVAASGPPAVGGAGYFPSSVPPPAAGGGQDPESQHPPPNKKPRNSNSNEDNDA